MVKLYLLDFIKQQRSNGYADDVIKDFLTKNGYSKADIDDAFKYALSNIAPPQEAQRSVLNKPVPQMQQPPAAPYAQQPKKASHHLGVYFAFLIIVLGVVAGALYMNGLFGTPAITMDELLSSIPFIGSQKEEAPATTAPVQQAPVQQPVQQTPQAQTAPETPVQPQTNQTAQANQTAVNQTVPRLNTTATTPKPAEAAIPADYKTYKNAKYSYQFSYPKTWNVSESTDMKTVTLSAPAYNTRYLKNDIKIHASPLTSSVSTLATFTSWVYTQFGFANQIGISSTLSGKDAYSLQKSTSSKAGADTLIKKYILMTGINKNTGQRL